MVQFVRIFYIGAVISALSLVPITGMAQDKKVIPPKEKVTESKEKSTVTKPGNSVTNKDQGVIQVREGGGRKISIYDPYIRRQVHCWVCRFCNQRRSDQGNC